MEQITVSNISIDVIRKDIKNIHLAVYPPTGRVRIAAPLTVNDDAIRLFAISKLGWIKRHQREFDSQERISPREYKQRESHYFQGRRYLMKIIEKDEPLRLELAEAAGMTYREYTLELMERGRHSPAKPRRSTRTHALFWGARAHTFQPVAV